MKFSALCLALALSAVSIASVGSAHAAGVLVTTDSGTIGGVEFTNLGITGGIATIEIERTPNLFSFINTVNGTSVVPEVATVSGPIFMFVSPVGLGQYDVSLSPANYTKTVGAVPGAQAIMTFDMTTGVAPIVLPNFFNMSGNITGLLANSNPDYDFSRFATSGMFNLTFTGTTFGGGISSFNGLFATVGSTIVANGSFSQVGAAVPEPTSVGMLCVGLSGLLGLLRLRIRPTLA